MTWDGGMRTQDGAGYHIDLLVLDLTEDEGCKLPGVRGEVLYNGKYPRRKQMGCSETPLKVS